MVKLEQIALNRAVYPRVGLESFFALCAGLGKEMVDKTVGELVEPAEGVLASKGL